MFQNDAGIVRRSPLTRVARRAREAVYGAVETFWAAAFFRRWGSGLPHPSHPVSSGGQRVLVLAPHPDDEVVGCAGTLVLHQRAGDEVCVVYVTDGRASRAMGLDADTMASRRFQEAHVSAKCLKATRMEWLGLHEGEWTYAELVPRLQALCDEFAPDVIYAPSRVDFHPEHFRVAHALASVLQPFGPETLRIYSLQVPLTPRLANRLVTVDEASPEMRAAFDGYLTQRGSTLRAWRARRYNAAMYDAGTLVEEFWEMSAGQYRELHSTLPETWSAHAFRSLRYAPFTDPLAYIQGRGERERLAEQVASSR